MSALTHAQRSAFAREGFLRFGRIYDDAELTRLRRAVERSRARADGLDLGRHAGRRMMLHNRLSADSRLLAEQIAHPVIARTAAALLETSCVRLMEDQLLVKEPHVSGAVHWHQDISFWPVRPVRQLSCWVALDRVTPDSGAMRFVPGSHLFGTIHASIHLATGVVRASDDRDAIPSDPEAEGLEVQTVALEAGECLFHHFATWHASGPNLGEGPRRALIMRYMAHDTYVDPDRLRAHPVAELEGLPLDAPITDARFPVAWAEAGT